ncbi:trem-like transcript 4 protein [Notamacropus eugenii]|uniref:trem-like transcript 4 protein n=1 Tax=Notamacropus eugenii TaxID=9315 RepID=UPI003B6810A8
MKYKEGQTLTVHCSYKLQRPKNRWKTWCKLQENGRLCERLITRTPVFLGQRRDARVSLEDDTSTGTIIITMSNLTVENSGIYWYGIYDSASNTIDIIKRISLEVAPATSFKTTECSQLTTEIPLTTSATPLATSSPPHSSIFSSSSVIQVLCGLIVAKGLVFTALLVLLGRCRDPEKGRGHSELSQEQNDLK